MISINLQNVCSCVVPLAKWMIVQWYRLLSLLRPCAHRLFDAACTALHGLRGLMVLAQDEGAPFLSDEHAAKIEAEVTRRLEAHSSAVDVDAELVLAKDKEIAELQQQVAMHEKARERGAALRAAEAAGVQGAEEAAASATPTVHPTPTDFVELQETFRSAMSELGLTAPAGGSLADQMGAFITAHKRREAGWREELARMEALLVAEADRAEALAADVTALTQRAHSPPDAVRGPGGREDALDAVLDEVARDNDSVARSPRRARGLESPEGAKARMQALEAELIDLRAAGGPKVHYYMRRVRELDEDASALRLEATAAALREHEAASIQRDLHAQYNALMRNGALVEAELAQARAEHTAEAARSAAAVVAMEGMRTELTRLTGALEGAGSDDGWNAARTGTAFMRRSNMGRVRDDSRREAAMKTALASIGQLRHNMTHTLAGLKMKIMTKDVDLYTRTQQRWGVASKGEFDTLVVRIGAGPILPTPPPAASTPPVPQPSLMPPWRQSSSMAPTMVTTMVPRVADPTPPSLVPTPPPPPPPTSPPLQPSLYMPPSLMPPMVSPRRAAAPRPESGSRAPLEKQAVRQSQFPQGTLEEQRRRRPGTAGFLSSPRRLAADARG